MSRLNVGEPRVPRYESVRGAPKRCIPLTNSERGSLGCLNKYRFAHIDGLTQKENGDKLLFGSCWHACVEHFHNFLKDNPSLTYSEHNDIELVCDRSVNLVLGKEDSIENVDSYEFKTRLFDLFSFWLDYYGSEVQDNYVVLAAELQLAVPIVNPATRKTFKPKTNLTRYLTDTGVCYKISGRTDKPCKTVRWPYYQFFTVDALYKCKQTGKLFVFEAKTAASPGHRIQTASVDPQLIGYCHGVQQAVKLGIIDGTCSTDVVAGFVFDAVCNKVQSKPKRNKNGSMSKAVKPTSYMIRKWITENGEDEADYADALIDAEMTTDTKFLQRMVGAVCWNEMARFGAEIYGTAEIISKLRSKAVGCVTNREVEAAFPRTPVCMAGFCKFKSICLVNTEKEPLTHLYMVSNFKQADNVRWPDLNNNKEKKEVIAW